MPTDPRGLRTEAPLLDAWLRFQESPPTPFTIPGHKQRDDLVGDVVAGDVPLYAGLDTMKLTTGVVVGESPGLGDDSGLPSAALAHAASVRSDATLATRMLGFMRAMCDSKFFGYLENRTGNDPWGTRAHRQLRSSHNAPDEED